MSTVTFQSFDNEHFPEYKKENNFNTETHYKSITSNDYNFTNNTCVLDNK